MERLHALLREKVRREQLTTTAAPASGATGTDGKSKKCWLCGCDARLRYRLKDTSSLCFPCFRTAYIGLVLPFIDTPKRRASDAATLKNIEKMAEERRAAAASPEQSNVLPPTSESSIFEPSQASFVMSASRMRQRLQQTTSSEASAQQPKQQPPRQYWNCPRCTYVNPLSAKRCEACEFANSTTVKCPHCNVLCPVDPESAKATRSFCSNGKLHVPWCCGECGQVNTLDGDACEHCHKARYWACTYCTALHNVGRSKDGLRYCPTCGSYNTPEDVQKGLETINAEHKKANMMARQAGPAGGDVVFGVNDAQTLAEQQRQKDIEVNTARLNQRLDKLQIRRISQKSDGNCLFSALAHQLFGNQQLHYLVRSCVVAYMRENSSDYVILFDGEAEWSAYINQMKENGTWGDELCINAAARCFCVNVHVITSDPERWHMVFQQDELGKSETNLRDKLPNPNDESPIYSSTRPGKAETRAASNAGSTLSLFLAYLYPVHFDDVTPSEVPAVVLSDLMIPELHKMLNKEGHTQSPRSPGTPSTTAAAASSHHPAAAKGNATSTATAATTNSSKGETAPHSSAPPPYDLGFDTSIHSTSIGATTRRKSSSGEGTALVPSLHSEQHQEHKGSAVSTSPTIERPVVPRARGPNSSPPPTSAFSASNLELSGRSQPQPPPPSHNPPSSRAEKTNGDPYKL